MRNLWIVAVLAIPALAGCASPDVSDPRDDEAEPGWAPETDVAIMLVNGTSPVQLDSLTDAAFDIDVFARLASSVGTYYSIGTTTFEPTIGVTSTGAIFMPSLKRVIDPANLRVDESTHVIRSLDQGQNWTDVGPFIGPTDQRQVPNSNDPYLYVDPWTDRVINFDMCLPLAAFCFEYSDDDGETWLLQTISTGGSTALDHQSLASAPATEATPTVLYPNVLSWCVNRGPQNVGPWCSSSFDGGISWTALVPGYPLGTPQCSGLHGHLVGAPDGAFYRGNPSCAGPAVYRSDDGGLTWTEHRIPTEVGVRGHEIATAVDEENNVYAFWIGSDGLPYLAASQDRAATWSGPWQVGAAHVTATGFPTIAAGGPGSVAFAYIGTDVEGGYEGDAEAMDWTGYIGISVDALADQPMVASVPVNAPDDPLDAERACGAMRCGGFGDFIDITIDSEGRPWAALAHNGHGDAGIVGTLAHGPSLRGAGNLTALPLGGPGEWA